RRAHPATDRYTLICEEPLCLSMHMSGPGDAVRVSAPMSGRFAVTCATSLPELFSQVHGHDSRLHVHASNVQCDFWATPRTLGDAVTSASAEPP
ncbi:MAG: hypothetical protein ACTH43_17505, partial [Brachybacterium sp.]|uniref:hypothetical protein n=1 Tax=Brachybacterium sp. TaxID=1891286 RepID=UPI003F8EBA40